MTQKSSPIQLSLAIMHAPLTSPRVRLLGETLRSLGPSVSDVKQHLVDFRIVVDTIGRGPWATAKAAWQSMPPDATHHMVLQDDVIVCPDFLDGAKSALNSVPDQIVTFFCNRKQPMIQASAANSSWFTSPLEVRGICIAMPRSLVVEFLSWEEKHMRPELKHDDTRVSLFAYAMKRDIWVTVPSLVKHAGASHSTLGHSASWQVQAAMMQTESALTIDWSRGLPVPPRAPGTGSIPRQFREWYVE